MRISQVDLQIEDIRWFGIDCNNRIFECTSAGIANVPEFVCKSKEETIMLEKFFEEILGELGNAKVLVDVNNINPLLEYCINLAKKGIFCFDIINYNSNNYIKVVEPTIEIFYSDLPEQIKKVLRDHFVLSADVKKDKILYVEHAY